MSRQSLTNDNEINDLLASNRNWIDEVTGKPMIELSWEDGHTEIEELARVVYILAHVPSGLALEEDTKITQSCGDIRCINPEHLVMVNRCMILILEV